jgi:Rab3 GTPase-activating protein catalytic subunit
MYLSCIWSNLSEDIIVDNESFTDLNPQYSNDWSLTISNIMDKCDLQLTNLLLKYTEELKRTISVAQLLGGLSSNSSTTQLFDVQNSNINEELKKSSLQKLTNAKSAIRLDHVYNLSSNVMDLAASKMKALNINDSSLPLDKGLMEFIMDYLFPDANLSKSKSNLNKKTFDETLYNDSNIKSFLKKLNLMKSSSIDNTGLLNKFVNCLAIVNQIGQTKAIAQLWREFLLEIRYRYENSILIPNVMTSFSDPLKFEQQNAPDLSRCLLHQKLQMLNCCIKKKLDRQKYELNQSTNNQENNDEDDDEFYDCEESESNIQEETFKPDGRSKKFGKLTLLNNPNEYIYVPITQEPTPMTEDMIEQHASVLVNLGFSYFLRKIYLDYKNI